MTVLARREGRKYIIALAALLLLSLIAPFGATSSPALAQETPEIGTVETIALDASGNGWAWAGPPPQVFQRSILLHIENGSWKIAADSEVSDDILFSGSRMERIVLTERGDAGWAIGAICCDASPAMWRLQGGRWAPYTRNLVQGIRFYDITMNADGTDGWLTLFSERENRYKLLRLRNGQWDFVANPASGGALQLVAINTSGSEGWAVGPRNRANDVNAPHAAYRLNNGRWEAVAGDPYSTDYFPMRITADNLGNGWVITSFSPQESRSETKQSTLIRLSRNTAPKEIVPNVTPPQQEPNAPFYLDGLATDAIGRGWVMGSFAFGLSGPEPPEPALYQTALLRLDGDKVEQVAPSAVGYTGEENRRPLSTGITRSGAHTWVGGHNGIGFGRLQEIREPWTHERPPAANPLPGAGICFAAVPHCIRGVFATYWQTKGGLDLFGYPITPEVRETIDGKEYVVQYTQRARFEYHPENPAPNNVLLGLLGNTLAEPRLNEDPFKPKPPGLIPSAEWFEETQHNVRPPFIEYWKARGGLPVFGLPRSEAFEERNEADGKTYLVQYFERNRLEYHPEQRDPRFQMLLGLLGTEQFRKTYGYTP